MRRWLVITFGGLVGIVILVTAIGALLPQNHTATASVTLRQPPESVWAVVSELGEYPAWWPAVKSAERSSDELGREIWIHRDKRGQGMPLAVLESHHPARLVLLIASHDLPFGGTWTYQIQPTSAGGSLVTVTEDGEVYNPIFRFMSRFVFGHYTTIEHFLGALAARFDEADARVARVANR